MSGCPSYKMASVELFYSQVNRGEKYFEAKRTVLIAIIDFSLELTREIKKIETIWNLRENNQPQLKLTDLIELHIIKDGYKLPSFEIF